jgi:hypothetical protein
MRHAIPFASVMLIAPGKLRLGCDPGCSAALLAKSIHVWPQASTVRAEALI